MQSKRYLWMVLERFYGSINYYPELSLFGVACLSRTVHSLLFDDLILQIAFHEEMTKDRILYFLRERKNNDR